MSQVDDGSGTVIATYYYDPFGRRLWKEVSGERTNFYYTDEGLNAETDSSGTITKAYGFKPDSTWTTDPLFLKGEVGYGFYLNDHLGTPQKIISVYGAMLWSGIYDSFGNAEVHINSILINDLRFPGQSFDSDIYLHYNYHRYFNQKNGKYISKDPIGFTAGINLYHYTFNNPIIKIDPEGKIVILGTVVVVGGYAIAAILIYKDCIERCTGIELPRDPNCPRPDNWAKCGELCFTYASLLGFGSDPVGSTAITIGTELGKRIE